MPPLPARPLTLARAASAPRLTLAALALCSLSACEPAPPGAPLPQTPPTDAEQLAARPYLLDVPRGYQAGVAAPLVLLLHGYGSSAASVEAWYQLRPLALGGEGAGFLYARPEGTRDSTGSRNWNFSPVHAYPFDSDYLRAVIDDVKGKYSVDPRRVYVIGVSAGGHMAHRVGCELASRVAAIISVSGQVLTDPALCAPGAPVSVLQVHGDADPVIPYHGDPENPALPSALDTIGVWRRNDGCSGPLAATGRRLDLTRDVAGEETAVSAYNGCPPGIGVELWTLEGVGHHPDVQPTWASQLYGFLSAHPRP